MGECGRLHKGWRRRTGRLGHGVDSCRWSASASYPARAGMTTGAATKRPKEPGFAHSAPEQPTAPVPSALQRTTPTSLRVSPSPRPSSSDPRRGPGRRTDPTGHRVSAATAGTRGSMPAHASWAWLQISASPRPPCLRVTVSPLPPLPLPRPTQVGLAAVARGLGPGTHCPRPWPGDKASGTRVLRTAPTAWPGAPRPPSCRG